MLHSKEYSNILQNAKNNVQAKLHTSNLVFPRITFNLSLWTNLLLNKTFVSNAKNFWLIIYPFCVKDNKVFLTQ